MVFKTSCLVCNINQNCYNLYDVSGYTMCCKDDEGKEENYCAVKKCKKGFS